MVHLIAEERRDGDNESQAFKTKTWHVHLCKFVSIKSMDDFKLFTRARVPKSKSTSICIATIKTLILTRWYDMR